MEGGHHDHDHDHEHEEDEHHHEITYDEHIWTSPVGAKELCRAICETLCAADSAHADEYRANLDAYLAQLDQLDRQFRTVVDEAQRCTLVFGDRFPLLYFCKTYDLEYRAIERSMVWKPAMNDRNAVPSDVHRATTIQRGITYLASSNQRIGLVVIPRSISVAFAQPYASDEKSVFQIR